MIIEATKVMDFDALVGKTVMIKRRVNYATSASYNRVEGRVDHVTPHLLVVERTDIPLAPNSDYKQWVTFNHGDFLTGDYKLTVN